MGSYLSVYNNVDGGNSDNREEITVNDVSPNHPLSIDITIDNSNGVDETIFTMMPKPDMSSQMYTEKRSEEDYNEP